MSDTREQSRQAMRADGRCTGAMIFAVFGGGWLLFSLKWFQRLTPLSGGAIGLVVCGLVVTALRLRRRDEGTVPSEELAAEKKRDDRVFGVINAVTYSMVFLLFLLLPRFGLANYVFPGFVALVGLHFFPMPPLYQHRSNVIAGGFMVLWAAGCAVAFRTDGDRMAAFAALGAGLALWVGAAWALQTARALFRQVGASMP